MNYERQEQAFDIIANREREEERADSYDITYSDRGDRETWADMARQDAMQRKATIPELPEIGNHISIDYRWMEGNILLDSCRNEIKMRSEFGILASLEAEFAMIDLFYKWRTPGALNPRIQINHIKLSEGWE